MKQSTMLQTIIHLKTGDTSSAVMAFVAFALSLAGLLTASFADKKMIDKIR